MSELSMLRQLLTIKRQREHSIRSGLVRLGSEHASVVEQQVEAEAERQLGWRQWRAAGQAGELLDAVGVAHRKCSLGVFYQRDLELDAHLAGLQDERTRIGAALARQRQLLRRCLVEQEKLKFILECSA